MTVELLRVLKLFILIFRVWVLFFLVFSVDTLWHSLIIIVISLGSLFFTLKLMSICYTFVAYVKMQFSTYIKILLSNSRGGGNICLVIFNLSYNRRVFFLNARVRTPHNRIVLRSAKINIFWMLFVLYLLNLPFLLDFGWKPHLQVWIWLIAYHLRPWILTPHTLVYLVSLLIMILCISLGAFALFTYVSLNVRNLRFKQFSVIFLGYSNLHKVFVCYNAATNMIHISIKKKIFENQYLVSILCQSCSFLYFTFFLW